MTAMTALRAVPTVLLARGDVIDHKNKLYLVDAVQIRPDGETETVRVLARCSRARVTPVFSLRCVLTIDSAAVVAVLIGGAP